MGVNVDIAKGVETRYDTSGKLALPLPFKKIKKVRWKTLFQTSFVELLKGRGIFGPHRKTLKLCATLPLTLKKN